MKKDKSNYPNNYPNSYPNNYPNQLSQIQMKILEIIQENPTISVKQISEIIDEIKYDAVRWNIAELKKKQILERKGTTRKGTWTIKNDNGGNNLWKTI
ncbi:MAG: winged helix-turn-helix transcriptional regulator [Clostridia bacterium]|nr:winged helix-turn-helix transcriptional regulator [Clostridia bacterium]